MKIKPFETEHFYAKYEFNTPHQLCNSDCETVTIAELLAMADVPLSALGGLGLGYTESQGDPELRQMVAEAYTAVSPHNLIILGTPVEGIYLTARALLQPEDEVIVMTPAYDALINMFEHIVGAERVKKWHIQAMDDRWQIDLDSLRQLITPKTKLIVVNFPHNPTGYLPTPEEQASLIELVEQHELWLFYDEMYYGLVHSDTPSIPSAADLSERVITLSGLSKTYGLPGLRTGWLTIRDEPLFDSVMNWKFYTSICPPAPSEFLAKVAWSVREELRQKNILQIEHNLQLAEAFFEKWGELFGWKRPLAGSTALVKMNVPSVNAFATQMAEEAGILIHPATTLGADDYHFRMGFGRRTFANSLEHFDGYLAEIGRLGD